MGLTSKISSPRKGYWSSTTMWVDHLKMIKHMRFTVYLYMFHHISYSWTSLSRTPISRKQWISQSDFLVPTTYTFKWFTLDILNNWISQSFSKPHLVRDNAVWLYIHQIATHQWKSSWQRWPVSLPRPSEPYQIPANQWLRSLSCPPERKKLSS